MIKKMYLSCCVIICFVRFASSLTVDVPVCNPPNFPARGGYGPIQDYYIVGDIIHYYCNTDTYIGGNYFRRCEDYGDWTGEAPVCDGSTNIQTVNQTSTAEPQVENNATLALDGIRSTCSSTADGNNQYWMAIFKYPGELIRVMIFMPEGEVAYEVLLLKNDGSTLSCGIRRDNMGLIGWTFHNCPGPNNRDAIGVKIVSLSSTPLQICEIAAHVLTSPTCIDNNRLRIDNGRFNITRKTALLVCDEGFKTSVVRQLECKKDGVWKSKRLSCLEEPWHNEIERGREDNQSDNDP